MIHAVLAINNLGYIGKDGGLPWEHNREDFRNFWATVANQSVIVGSKTFESMPKQYLKLCSGITVARSSGPDIVGVVQNFKQNGGDFYIIGGKTIYEKCAHLVDVWHITRIDDNTIGDTHLDIKTLMYI